jgi:hypothetical protein
LRQDIGCHRGEAIANMRIQDGLRVHLDPGRVLWHIEIIGRGDEHNPAEVLQDTILRESIESSRVVIR